MFHLVVALGANSHHGIDLVRFGGAKGSRTPDLLHAMQALSQLSYGPILRRGGPFAWCIYEMANIKSRI